MIAHVDEVAWEELAIGEMRHARQRLGRAAGTSRVGLSRFRVAAGDRTTPVHQHADEEEIFYVLAGGGLVLGDDASHEVGAGDTIVHRAGAEAHALRAGEGSLDVLAFGDGSPTDITLVPRAGVFWLGTRWVPVEVEHPYRAEEAAGPLAWPEPSPRPANVVALADVAHDERRSETIARQRRDLGRAAGSVASGLKHVVVAPGMLGALPHSHSAEEELFYVLDGAGTLELGDERHAVRAGHVVARPPGTGVAHAFRGGREGLTLLAYGTRDPNDICFYPRSGNVFLRGVGVVFRPERVEYWDGEG